MNDLFRMTDEEMARLPPFSNKVMASSGLMIFEFCAALSSSIAVGRDGGTRPENMVLQRRAITVESD